MNNSLHKKIFYLSFVVLSSISSFAQKTEIVEQNGSLRVIVPPSTSALVSKKENPDGSSHFFFALGPPAENLTRSKSSLQPVDSFNLNMTDLALIADMQNHVIGAAYPIVSGREFYVTAMHLLKRSQFINEKFRTYKVIGFINPETGSLYDIALLIPAHASVEEFFQIIQTGENDSIQNIYVNHLNLLDKGTEVAFSKSEPTITSINEKYFFLRNNQNSTLGPSSSGAVVFSGSDNRPLGSIVCASKIVNNEHSSVIRTLKFSVLVSAQHVQINHSLIDNFQVLPCESYDGRRGGGD